MLQGRNLGKYEVKDMLGQGGMATVYRAYQPDIDRFVAIKVLPPHPAMDPTFVERFRQEARTIARLQHPHILPVYDYGSEDNILYLVMAFIDGGALSDLIKEGPLTLREIDKILTEVAGALDYAHRQGVVHRDIKPANILLDSEGHALLADFGIAKMAEGGANITGTGIVGTPAYMAPEQGQGMPPDKRADIYSLGVVVYEMLTGRHPYTADTAMKLILQHIQDPIPRLSDTAQGVPEALNQVIERVLAKEPDERYQTATEFANAFSHALKDVDSPTDFKLQSPKPMIGGQRTMVMEDDIHEKRTQENRATQVQPVPTVVLHPSSQPILLMGGFGLIALVIVVVAGLFLANMNREPATSPTDAPTQEVVAVDATPTSSVPTPTPIPTFGRLSFLSTNKTADTVSLVVTGLAPAGSGRIYVAWLTNPETESTMRLGQLSLDPLGNGSLTFSDVQQRTLPAAFSALIITSETELVNAPTGDVVYSGRVTTEVNQAFNEIFVASPNGIQSASDDSSGDYAAVTVDNTSLWSGLRAEASIGVQHAGLASNSGTIGALHLHAEHTINILRGTNEDLDGSGSGANPGRGIGVYRFLDWINEQLNLAGNAAGVSRRTQADIEMVRVCLDNARRWADEVVDLETQLLTAQDIEASHPTAEAATVAADHMMNGFDQNGNGQVEPFEGECGIMQIGDYGVIINSIDLFVGALPE